jgi:uncharacterized RDD family membrane protein YckC
MRCPKCHYISFGSVDRCRNCGYEFSLAPDVTPVDLPIQTGDQPIGPLGDLDLADRSRSAATTAAERPAVQSGASDESARGVHGPRATAPAKLELPLFVDRDPLDDAPLISAPSVPRQPLSVRRAQPPIPKPRPERPAAPALDRAFESEVDEDDRASEGQEDIEEGSSSRSHEREFRKLQASLQRSKPEPARPGSAARFAVASAGSRLLAGVVDVLILGSIDALVLYSTLRVVGLPFADVLELPAVPMLVFLLLLNGGYLSIFTAAGGQTIGKMLAGIRVIADEPKDDSGLDGFSPRVTMGAAVVRAAAYLVSLLPAGLGFAAILLDREGRALHDRLAETRVVKA